MRHGGRVAVVIPAYNEQRFIAEVLKRLPNWVDCVVVVDDASTDATVGAVEEFRRCQARGEGYSGPVELVSHSVNRGVGAAIVSGYRRALSRDVDCMVVMGGDAQMSPEDLPAVVEPIVRGEAHYVKGNRFAHRRVREMPRLRRWGGAFLAYWTSRMAGITVRDSQCGFTALAASAAEQLPLQSLWTRFGYPNDLLGMLAGRGAVVTEVPVEPIYADESSGIRWYHLAVVSYVIARRAWIRNGSRGAVGLGSERPTLPIPSCSSRRPVHTEP